jgi:hypothetical protein
MVRCEKKRTSKRVISAGFELTTLIEYYRFRVSTLVFTVQQVSDPFGVVATGNSGTS